METNHMQVNQIQDDEIEIDLMEVMMVLLHKAGVIFLAGLMMALLAIVGTKLLVTPQYQSVTKLYVLNKQDSNMLTSSDLQTSTLLTKDYAEIIQSRKVTEAVIAKLGLNLKHGEMLKKMEVVTGTDNRIVTIKVIDPDPYMARDIANAVRDTAAEHIKNVMNSEAVNIVDEANVPDSKYSPSTIKNGLIGGILGCILAVAIVMIQYLRNDTIQISEDVERYLNLSVLGTIPLEKTDGKKKKKIKRTRR
ncbi:MAG: YveK family protein [Oliverpabstia sp.]